MSVHTFNQKASTWDMLPQSGSNLLPRSKPLISLSLYILHYKKLLSLHPSLCHDAGIIFMNERVGWSAISLHLHSASTDILAVFEYISRPRVLVSQRLFMQLPGENWRDSWVDQLIWNLLVKMDFKKKRKEIDNRLNIKCVLLPG